MKKNLMKKALCAVSALTMMGSLAINASAAEYYGMLRTAGLDEYNSICQTLGDETISLAEKADILNSHMLWDYNDSADLTSHMMAYLYLEGQITYEEMDNAIETVANGGCLTGDLYDLEMSFETFTGYYDLLFGDEKDVDKLLRFFDIAIEMYDKYGVGFIPGEEADEAETFVMFYLSDDSELADRKINNTGISDEILLAALKALANGSGDINAPAATQLVWLVTPDNEASNFKFSVLNDESLTDAEKADLLKDYIVKDFNDNFTLTSMAMSFYYVVEGSITEKEMQDAVATVANGGELTGDLHDRENSVEFFFAMTDFLDDEENYERDSEGFSTLIEWLDTWQELHEQFNVAQMSVDWSFFSDDPELADRNINTTGISDEIILAALKALACGSGDINANGELELTDAVLLARAIGGSYELSADARSEADLNGDSEINAADLTAIMDKLAGK